MNDPGNGRGVRGAESGPYRGTHEAFIDQSENRLTSTQLQDQQNPRSRKKHMPSANESFLSYAGKLNTTDLKRLYRDVRQIFKEGDINVDDSELRELSEMKVGKIEKPIFPYFILGVSVIKDLLDIPANLSIVGIPFAMALSLICSLVIFFWIWGKMSGGWWKKRLLRWLFVRFFIMFGVELIVSIIPTTTIFTLMAYYREKKIVKLINLALEEMHRLVIK